MKDLVDSFLWDEMSAYVRIGRGAVPVIYSENVKVEIGKTVTWGDGKDIGIIACGQMVYRALDAAKMLEEEGICATVLDMYMIKPLDEAAIFELAKECGCKSNICESERINETEMRGSSQ